jgi:hypothetical protein
MSSERRREGRGVSGREERAERENGKKNSRITRIYELFNIYIVGHFSYRKVKGPNTARGPLAIGQSHTVTVKTGKSYGSSTEVPGTGIIKTGLEFSRKLRSPRAPNFSASEAADIHEKR